MSEDITEFANWPLNIELTDIQKQILALGVSPSALVKDPNKATSEIVEYADAFHIHQEEIIKPQTLTQVVDDVLASHEKGDWTPPERILGIDTASGSDYGVAAVYDGTKIVDERVLENKDFEETAKKFAEYYDKVDVTTKPMHGYLTCTGEGCKVCNSIKVIKSRKAIAEEVKINKLMQEYIAQLGREPTAEEKKEFFKVLDILNSKAKEEAFMGDFGYLGREVFKPAPTKSQIGQALANQKRAMKLANRLKRKEKAAKNRCKGY